MAGRRRGGKSKQAREDPARFEEGRPKRTLLLSSFFRPPDKRKTPNLMDYSIHPSDWSPICHSTA